MFPQQLLTVDSGGMKADVIILLGGSPEGRPERAAELFREGAAPRILVSGRGDNESFSELLEENGVPAGAIMHEPNSRSTWENAKFAVPLLRELGARRAIIVTSWYHSRRAAACFRHFAPDVEFYSRPSYFGYNLRRNWYHDFMGFHVFIEYLKIFRYGVVYGISSWS